MKLELGNVWAKVLEASPTEQAELERYLLDLLREAPPDEPRRLYENGRFPAGLVPLLEQRFGAEVEDAREEPCEAVEADLGWLYADQRDAVRAALSETRGVVKFPMGAGKTHVAMGLMLSVPCRWLFLVHRRALRTQALERFAAKVLATRLQSDDGPGVTVATVQGLAAGLRDADPATLAFLGRVQGLIFDECHGVAAAGTYQLLQAMPNAFYRVGLSATPYQRGDKLDAFTVGAIGPTIATVSVAELQAQGRLAVGKAVFTPFDGHTDEGFDSWDLLYQRAIVSNDARNALVCDLAEKAEKPALVFVRLREHGARLEALLHERGQRVLYLDGEFGDGARGQALAALQEGRVDVVVSTGILEQGVDLPALRSVVVAAGGKAEISVIQRLGRAMRAAPGKASFALCDVWDSGHPTLERHSRLRATAYRKAEIPVEGVPAREEPTGGPSSEAVWADFRARHLPGSAPSDEALMAELEAKLGPLQEGHARVIFRSYDDWPKRDGKYIAFGHGEMPEDFIVAEYKAGRLQMMPSGKFVPAAALIPEIEQREWYPEDMPQPGSVGDKIAKFVVWFFAIGIPIEFLLRFLLRS